MGQDEQQEQEVVDAILVRRHGFPVVVHRYLETEAEAVLPVLAAEDDCRCRHLMVKVAWADVADLQYQQQSL